jgi:hypothetical protein
MNNGGNASDVTQNCEHIEREKRGRQLGRPIRGKIRTFKIKREFLLKWAPYVNQKGTSSQIQHFVQLCPGTPPSHAHPVTAQFAKHPPYPAFEPQQSMQANESC